MPMDDFYRDIEHTPVQWREYTLHVPLFYPDIRFMSVTLAVPLERLRSILPSPRLHPYRLTPRLGIFSLTAYEYRETDLGPYNEVSFGVPVTIDRETPVYTGILRKPPTMTLVYSHKLPVTTQIALDVGATFAGYPKFIAEIEISEEGGWLGCSLREGGKQILTLRGRMLETQQRPRVRVHPITNRGGSILRSELVLSARETGISKGAQDVSLVWGEHPLAGEIESLGLERILNYTYCPQVKGILTPVIERYAG